MLLAVILAGAILFRVPIVMIAGMIAIAVLPVPLALAAVLAVVAGAGAMRARGRRELDGHEAVLLRQISGRIASGATMRSTIADTSIDAIPESARRLAVVGEPMANVASAIAPVLPVNGAAFQAICSFSEHTGAAISTALSVLADRADEAAELTRQRTIALAQVKLSAVVVGLVPIVVSIALLAMRGVPEPGGAVIVVPMLLGLLLQITGTAVVFRVASRAR
jgi:Flp pilus assembly protein TadB